MGIVVEGNYSRFVSCVVTCTTDWIQDNEITRLKEGKPCEQFRLINKKEPNPIVIDDADVDSLNPEIMTVEEDKDGDEDDDVEINI